jgi:dTDP-4-dehydrorhamnose reductase
MEKEVVGAGGLIARTHLFGWSPNGNTFAERMVSLLQDARPCFASGTRYATPILASQFADLLWQAWRRKLSGLRHFGGAERASMWQFAAVLAQASGYSLKIMRATAPASGHDPALAIQNRSGQETSLDSRKLQRELDVFLPRLREGIEQFLEQQANGYRDRIATSRQVEFVESSAA